MHTTSLTINWSKGAHVKCNLHYVKRDSPPGLGCTQGWLMIIAHRIKQPKNLF